MAARFSADYAKRASNCKKCKESLPKESFRLAKITPNPFGSDGGDMKTYFHPKCIFDTFQRARTTTTVIESAADIEGWSNVQEDEKKEILKLIADLEKFRSTKKTPTKKKTETPKKDQLTLDQSFGTKPIETSAGSTSHTNEEEEVSVDKSIDAGEDDSWLSFCKLCNKITADSKYTSKTAVVKNFIEKGTSGDEYDGDLYLLCKLLLPGVDHRVYNLKEKQMAKLFSQIFLCEQEEMMDHFNNSGDVSDTVRHFYNKSSLSSKTQQSTLTLQEVDKWLNQLTSITREEEQQRHLSKIVKRCNAEDLQFVVREIRKDLRINAGAKHVLDALAPNAYEAFQASRNLQHVVQRSLEKKASPGMNRQISISVQLGTAVLPMLAEPCRTVGYAMKKCPNGMFAEIKYDGERVQLHKKGSDFYYFSRSLKPVQPHKVLNIKEYIPKAFVGGGDIILDSEVLLIDTKTGKPLPFGTLGVHKKRAFENANVCLFVFDCLLYQGKSLLDRPLSERKKMLEDNMTEVPNRIMLSDYELIENGETTKLKSMINKAIDEGLEGLVLKDTQSYYEPGKRHWLKVKKDYLEEGSMADSADLIVLGAYYGTGNKGGMMSVFLMGCYNPKTGKYCTVTKCGNGHDDATLEKINKEMKNDVDKILKNYDKIPKWLQCSRQLVPDFVVCDPEKAPIWEISGAEFSKSEAHTADGISIRFPRVTKIRDDKSWKTATNLDELKILFAKSKEKSDLSSEGSPKKKEKESPCKDIKISKEHSLGSRLDNWDDNIETTTTNNDKPSSSTRKVKADDSDSEVNQSPPRKRAKVSCKYGKNCYQKNPTHKEQFWHPGDDPESLQKEEKSDSPESENIFSNLRICIVNPKMPRREKLIRYINFFGGEFLDEFDLENATHVVVQENGGKPDGCPDVPVVSVNWIWDSVKDQQLKSIDNYKQT